MKLVEGVRYRIMITGTPVLNRPKELLCQLEIAGLTYKFGGEDKFLQDFCGSYISPWGTSHDGHSNLSKLNEAMKKVWIDVSKKMYRKIFLLKLSTWFRVVQYLNQNQLRLRRLKIR